VRITLVTGRDSGTRHHGDVLSVPAKTPLLIFFVGWAFDFPWIFCTIYCLLAADFKCVADLLYNLLYRVLYDNSTTHRGKCSLGFNSCFPKRKLTSALSRKSGKNTPIKQKILVVCDHEPHLTLRHCANYSGQHEWERRNVKH